MGFFLPPRLSDSLANETYRHHLRFVIIHGIASGILTNSGIMAIQTLGAEDWELVLRIPLSSAGMFATLLLGNAMVGRRKMPFVLLPGLAFAICCVIAALLRDPFWFLFVLGIASAFEILSRIGITSIVRLNYPADSRATATGELRKWASLVFLLATSASAWLLQVVPWREGMITLQLSVAAVAGLTSFFCFRRIRVREQLVEEGDPSTEAMAARTRSAWRASIDILRRDRRFRHYLVSCFLFGSSHLIYMSFIPAFLKEDLGLGYMWSAMLYDIIPSLGAFMFTGLLGRWVDRQSPWMAWLAIRVGWGIDPILLAWCPLIAMYSLPAAIAVACAARLCRGATQGGFWILWWRVGIAHFAPPGEETSRYMGIFVFQNGVMSLLGPALGAVIVVYYSRETMLLVGGIGVMLAALHAFWRLRAEAYEESLATIAQFESRFAAKEGGIEGSPEL